jgi:hypothetical protein
MLIVSLVPQSASIFRLHTPRAWRLLRFNGNLSLSARPTFRSVPRRSVLSFNRAFSAGFNRPVVNGRRLAPAPFESHIVVGHHAQALGAREDVLAGLDAVPIVGAGTRFVDGTEPCLIA